MQRAVCCIPKEGDVEGLAVWPIGQRLNPQPTRCSLRQHSAAGEHCGLRGADIKKLVDRIKDLLGLDGWYVNAQLHIPGARAVGETQLERIRTGAEIGWEGNLQVIGRAGGAQDRLRNDNTAVIGRKTCGRIDGGLHIKTGTARLRVGSHRHTCHVALQFDHKACRAAARYIGSARTEKRLERSR